jgi:hypothetical protein
MSQPSDDTLNLTPTEAGIYWAWLKGAEPEDRPLLIYVGGVAPFLRIGGIVSGQTLCCVWQHAREVGWIWGPKIEGPPTRPEKA